MVNLLLLQEKNLKYALNADGTWVYQQLETNYKYLVLYIILALVCEGITFEGIIEIIVTKQQAASKHRKWHHHWEASSNLYLSPCHNTEARTSVHFAPELLLNDKTIPLLILILSGCTPAEGSPTSVCLLLTLVTAVVKANSLAPA